MTTKNRGKELSDFSNDEIINPDLIGGGIPDLETELAKMSSGQEEQETTSDDFGGFGSDEGFGNFGFNQEAKEKQSEEED